MRHIEVIPAELEMRIRALAMEAEALLPAIESLAERAWHATEEYAKELDPVFDWDKAGERTSYARLLQGHPHPGGQPRARVRLRLRCRLRAFMAPGTLSLTRVSSWKQVPGHHKDDADDLNERGAQPGANRGCRYVPGPPPRGVEDENDVGED